METEKIQYQIDVEATKALLALRNLGIGATDADTRIKTLTHTAKELQAQFGLTTPQIIGNLKEIDASVSKIASDKEWKQVERNLNNTEQASGKIGDSFESGAKRAVSAVNLLRIALGALVAMILFNVIQAFQLMIKGALDGMRQLELATTNLIEAEKQLSQSGVEITPKDLDSFIAKLQKLDPLLSKLEATQAVSDVATRLGAPLKLSKEQMDSFLTSMTALAVKGRALGKDFGSVMEEGISAILSGRVSKGLNDLGVTISDDIVKTKAWKMGLIETVDAYDKLSGEAKKYVQASAIIQILQESTADTVKHLPDYFKGADAAFGMVQANLKDVLTDIGKQLAPLIIKVLQTIAEWLQKADVWINKNKDAITVWVTVLEIVFVGLTKILGVVIKLGTAFGWMGSIMDNAANTLQKFLDKHPALKKMVDTIQKAFPDIANAQDTPTNPNAPSPEASQDEENKSKAVADAESKIQDIMQESANKKADIELEYSRKLSDIALDNQRKLEDISRETAQKQEDALRNYNQKVEDINRDANEKAAAAKDEKNNQDLDREKKYQENLRHLREKFIEDLEDALRERDARQVLKLIKKYNEDKKHLEEERKLQKDQAKKDLTQKLADIEHDRQLKLQAAQRELADKQAEIDRWAARERQDAQIALQRKLADARIWHQRELADYQNYLNQKLKALAASIVKEYQLTAQGAQSIYTLLNGYYGQGGSLSNLLQNGLQSNLNGILSSSSGGAGGRPIVDPSWAQNGFFGAAEGGTFIATRPTKMMVGEKGMEQVSVTPLGRSGTDVNKVFTNAGVGGGSMGGSLNLRVSISDGLVAEIVDTSLDNVAAVIEKIRREKG